MPAWQPLQRHGADCKYCLPRSLARSANEPSQLVNVAYSYQHFRNECLRALPHGGALCVTLLLSTPTTPVKAGPRGDAVNPDIGEQ